MENINLPPFYVGQRVVYITGINMPKNSIHTIADLFQHPCGHWVVDVNKVGEHHLTISCDCNDSNQRMPMNNNKRYFAAESFRPIYENFQSISLEKVLEEETKLISVN